MNEERVRQLLAQLEAELDNEPFDVWFCYSGDTPELKLGYIDLHRDAYLSQDELDEELARCAVAFEDLLYANSPAEYYDALKDAFRKRS